MGNANTARINPGPMRVCWRCLPSRGPASGGLTRRSFQGGLLAAACLPMGEALVEPAMRLALPPDAPRTVALTLDACGGATDMRIVTALLALSVPATIFATGLWLRNNAQALVLMRAHPQIFTLQNHGAQHLPPVLGTRRVYGLPVAGTLEAVRAEVTGGAEMVAAARGPRPAWYRGAAGLYSPAALAAIQAMGVAVAGYSLNGDAGASLPAATVARRIAAARGGDVIVSHINQPGRPSGAGVAVGIAALKQAGVVFAGLDAAPVTPLAC
jgi:peptidoglycan/xylan/chitin deacetylase (PgdA/CDA1 family)